jgi:hypothetical protein
VIPGEKAKMDDSMDTELKAELEQISRQIDAIVEKIRQAQPADELNPQPHNEQPLS